MRVRVGTSGYSYKEWKGNFYPEGLPESEMLRFYSGRFPTVEINNTFYRMPSRQILARWSEETPEGFTFVLKAPQRITHQGRLTGGDALTYFLGAASAMEAKLGPVLFQLPPFFKKDLERLKRFLSLLPRDHRTAFEFRHESWFEEEVFAALSGGGAALCAADTDEAEAALVPTAAWGYLRLRRADYDDASLTAWAARIRSQPWGEAYVFFKHEEKGRGPELAARFAALLAP